ncbi:MFS transporter [Burkholderia ubonensis]|uniref:Major facilitator superfamily (MFS) profile domain-containing protein n=1 Tax=Burkholderia ubonensis subsp. mesacidophila TaxID=265293 RepID=A0A2A4FEK4_9BURK|nr:MFS transporter [Burkholderia ubonensis]PCE30739.1 hypothetical protein BZL54_19050 [Burkholderia ubonensis subsp. mesacidophila]
MSSINSLHPPLGDTVEPRRWTMLAILLCGIFLAPLDFFIVNVALPAIQHELHATSAQLQLIISTFAASYAVFLIIGGRLGDLYGRSRVFTIGLLGFVASSIMCGLAPTITFLIVGRALQGLSAAVMVPQGLATVNVIFPAQEKPRAFSVYAATYGFASAAAQIIGGLLISLDILHLGWRAIFLLNVPVGIAVVCIATPVLPKLAGLTGRKLDVKGVILLALALASLIVALIEGREAGWPWWSFGLLVVAFPLLLLGFWKHEQRVARGGWPLVDPEALRIPSVRLGLGAALFFYSIAVMFLLLAIYLQDGLGEDPFTAGLRFAPFGIGFFLGPLCAPRATRITGAWTVVLALLVEVAALLAAAWEVWSALPGSTAALVPLLFLIGFGQGLAMPMLLRVILAEAPAHLSGLMSGMINSTFQISAALGVAVIGSVYYAWLGAGTGPGAIGPAFAVALVCVAACLGVSALLLAMMIRTKKAAA